MDQTATTYIWIQTRFMNPRRICPEESIMSWQAHSPLLSKTQKEKKSSIIFPSAVQRPLQATFSMRNDTLLASVIPKMHFSIQLNKIYLGRRDRKKIVFMSPSSEASRDCSGSDLQMESSLQLQGRETMFHWSRVGLFTVVIDQGKQLLHWKKGGASHCGPVLL